MPVGTVSDGRRKGEKFMKLYFYILTKETKTDSHIIRYEECEVIEKPKTYYPLDKFPNGIYRGFILKGEIGNFLDHYLKNVVVLDENNPEKAIKLFEERSKRRIEELNKSISIQKSILKAVEDYRKNG